MKKILLFLLSFFSDERGRATRESILNSSDRIAGFVDVPEWGGLVYVATLSVAQRAQFLSDLGRFGAMGQSDPVSAAVEYFNAQVQLIASAVVSENSAPLFSTEDVEQLRKKSPAIIGRLYDEIVRVNGFAVVASEDAAKN